MVGQCEWSLDKNLHNGNMNHMSRWQAVIKKLKDWKRNSHRILEMDWCCLKFHFVLQRLNFVDSDVKNSKVVHCPMETIHTINFFVKYWPSNLVSNYLFKDVWKIIAILHDFTKNITFKENWILFKQHSFCIFLMFQGR